MAKVTQAEYQKVQDSLNNQYTSDSLSQYKTAYNDYKAQWMSTADAVKKAQSLLVAKGAWTSNTNKADTTINNNVPSWSTGSQQSSYSNYNKPNVDVSREAPVPKQYQVESKAAEDAASKIGAKWNEKSFEEQQYYLNNIPWLKEALAKRWITAKTGKEFATPTAPTTPTTSDRNTPKGEWDYQDDSPERMSQIIDNLNRLRQSDPYLFSDYNAFYKAFIDWKGRTQWQIDTLNSYFNSMKKYGKYDSMSPEDIWAWLVNGTIPDDYLTYVKNADPQRYAEIQDARKKGEDKIKDEAALDTINVMTWEGSTSTSNVIEWLKKQWLFVDEDWNLIDDRTENYASEEELWYQKQIADLNATNLDIDNTVKHTYDDLVKKYPWATKSTLMAMAQDMNADLLREKENNLVELTRLQGYVWYMQQEREDRTQIWKDSIAQLQKEYWMYYDYSPEWMSELAQAQYAATNVTLDQADNGTDTQKQMALDSVLTDYFDKYWSIIQRSKSQVINDVMALAKNKGISLSQALEENFLKPLRSKPWFAALNTVTTNNPDVFKIWEDTYWYWDENGNLVPIGWTYWSNWVYQFSDAEVRTWDTIWNDINSIWHILDSEDWLRVWTYKSSNGYTYNVYANREDWIKATENLLKRWYYGMTLADAAQKWIWQWKDITTAKNIIKQKWLSLNEKLSDSNVRKFIEAMWTWEWTLKWWQSLDDWAKWWKSLWTWSQWWQLYNPNLVEIYRIWWDTAKDSSTDQDRFWKMYGDEISAAWVSKEQFMKQYEEWYAEESADAYKEVLAHLDQLIELTWWEYDLWERWDSIRWIKDVWAVYDYIKNNLTVNWLRDAKAQWLKLWVLSDSDVKMIWSAATTLKWNQSQKSWNRELNDFREKLLSKNKYLRQKYQNTSAYTPNTSISFTADGSKFTIWQQSNSKSTKKWKIIKSLWI